MSIRYFYTLAFCILFGCVSAQNKLPFDTALQKITYRFSIPLDKPMHTDDAFELAQQWFTKNTALFNRGNAIALQEPANPKSVNVKNREEVNRVFANAYPLQSLDPASNRMTGKVITRFGGDAGGTLRLLYLEYYLIVTVNNNYLQCEITNFRYNHFNPNNYLLQRILSFKDSYSCDPVNTMEYLVKTENSHAEFEKLYCFLNDDIDALFAHFKDFVKSNGSLSMNR